MYCKKRRAAILLTAALLLPFLAVAQTTVNVTPELQRKPVKSKAEAMQLSFINTVMPVAAGIATAGLFENHTVKKIGASMVVYGLLSGPSTGNFYASDYLRGSLGILTRVGSGILLTGVTREVFGRNVSDPLGWDNDHRVSFTDTKILVGTALFAGSMIYNVFSSKSSVEEYNARFSMGGGFSQLRVPVAQGEVRHVPVVTAKIAF